MPDSDGAALENLLSALERELASNARRAERRALWTAAQHYRRSQAWLQDLLPPDLLNLALKDLSCPKVTWQALRHLCRETRFHRRSRLGNFLRLKRCRTMAAGEVRLLRQQRAVRQDLSFMGDFTRTFG